MTQSTTVREARDAYLAENGFTVAGYDEPKTEASFMGIRFTVPNTPRHRFAIMLHDLHHVATGFGTDIVGEGEISAWELRHIRALGWYVGGIVALGAFAGAAAAPRRAWAAFRGMRGKTLFELARTEAEYEALLDLDVSELRRRLNVPPDGLARGPRHLHRYAPPRS